MKAIQFAIFTFVAFALSGKMHAAQAADQVADPIASVTSVTTRNVQVIHTARESEVIGTAVNNTDRTLETVRITFDVVVGRPGHLRIVPVTYVGHNIEPGVAWRVRVKVPAPFDRDVTPPATVASVKATPALDLNTGEVIADR